jgi:hypothetical protein
MLTSLSVPEVQMFVRFRRQLSVLALTVVAGACGSDSTGPTNYPPATLDQALAELSIPALSAVGNSFAEVDATPTLDPANCPYSAAVQSFVCTPISGSGVTVNHSYTLLSPSGAKQSAFDPAGTAAVRANTTVAGSLVEQGTTLTIDGQQELTLSGLIAGPHVLNGTSTISLAGTVEDETSTYPIDITVATTIANLVMPPNAAGSADVWPLSGKITVDVNGSIGPLTVSSARTTLTFNGTSTVDVTMTGGGLSKSCKVDLAVAAPVCE